MKTSTVADICKEVRLSMTRFRCSPQRWDQLYRKLKSEEQEKVAEALLACLEEVSEDMPGRQTYLHGLLRALRPRPRLPLAALLERHLPSWNKEAADFPSYLADVYGAEQLHEVLDVLDRKLDSKEALEKTSRMRCATGLQVLP